MPHGQTPSQTHPRSTSKHLNQETAPARQETTPSQQVEDTLDTCHVLGFLLLAQFQVGKSFPPQAQVLWAPELWKQSHLASLLSSGANMKTCNEIIFQSVFPKSSNQRHSSMIELRCKHAQKCGQASLCDCLQGIRGIQQI